MEAVFATTRRTSELIVGPKSISYGAESRAPQTGDDTPSGFPAGEVILAISDPHVQLEIEQAETT
jgi:hypothetical protein